MKWFKDDEFKCKCGCGMDVKAELKEKLEDARELAGSAFIITSGARCLEHNHKIGSKDTSSHIKGLAADIKYQDDLHLTRIVHALSRVGFVRIGVNEKLKFIHCDLDSQKPASVFGY